MASDKHQQIQQMGDIYAAAKLTIIASSGEDPSSGLPGISRPRQLPPVLRLATLSVIPHQTDGLAGISQSVWASRAWTFQEGFLSTRRLFFTAKQIVYICTASMRTESARQELYSMQREILGPLSSALSWTRRGSEYFLWLKHSLVSAMALVEEYTKRSLSYDSDALNAVVGALKSLRRLPEPVHHIWGVPICTGHDDSERLALHWHHDRPAARRPSFPSWSPLGWQGPVFFDDKWQPIIPEMCAITFPTATSSRQIRLSVPNPPDADLSSCLQVSTTVVKLSLVQLDGDLGDDQRREFYVAFPWVKTEKADKRLDVYITPSWDQVPSRLDNGHMALKFVLLMGDPRELRFPFSCIILILQRKGPHYERVGYLNYPKGRASEHIEGKRQAEFYEREDREQEDARRDKETRSIWCLQKGKMTRIEDESWLRNACWRGWEPTWLNTATKETFLLC